MTHDVHENSWKCGALTLYFSPSAGGITKKAIQRSIYTKPRPTEPTKKYVGNVFYDHDYMLTR